jgi:eukaryotic-like serine/threonine-protein kinase
MKTFFSRFAGTRPTPIQHRESVKRIGDYSIVREIGAGATSNVFLGIHVRTLAAAAIKQLSPQFTSAAHREMFATEASLCGKMAHPNIVDMYGAEMGAGESPYLVMEYVDGNSLDKFDSPETLLPIETVIDVMRQSAEALRYASRLGIVHRDVKPGNIIVRKDGRVKMADFGCAITSEPNKAVVAIAGSLPYMSPEQLQGEALGPQSDIYSLGVVFYRLLTGHYPFAMGDDQTARTYARKILAGRYAPVDAHRPDVPAGIKKFLDRALRTSPTERLTSWDEFLEQLHRASREKYAENEKLVLGWQSFEIRQRQLVVPRVHDLSFSF